MANRYLAQHEAAPTRDRPAHRGRDLAEHQAAAHPAAPAAPQAAAEAHRPQAAQEGKGSRRVGQADQRRRDLLLSAGGPGDRGLRPLPQEEGQGILSEERVRVEPFTTSILDGIDIRETIRNWHQRKIYVRQADRLAGEVGSVVVIFDEDRDDRYQYLTTWLGEHQNESDMAFYSTHPFDNMVGPGIGRAEYGGFLMTLPPRRMFDVWSDPDYDFAETKPERLLLAGLDYSVERHVVYVAAKPPRSIFRSIAAHLNRKILYVPIGQLSPTKLKKLRVVHVLDSYDRREKPKTTSGNWPPSLQTGLAHIAYRILTSPAGDGGGDQTAAMAAVGDEGAPLAASSVTGSNRTLTSDDNPGSCMVTPASTSRRQTVNEVNAAPFSAIYRSIQTLAGFLSITNRTFYDVLSGPSYPIVGPRSE